MCDAVYNHHLVQHCAMCWASLSGVTWRKHLGALVLCFVSSMVGSCEGYEHALQDYLARRGHSKGQIASIVAGFKQALGLTDLATLSFHDFAVCFRWFLNTLQLMDSMQDSQSYELPTSGSLSSNCSPVQVSSIQTTNHHD